MILYEQLSISSYSLKMSLNVNVCKNISSSIHMRSCRIMVHVFCLFTNMPDLWNFLILQTQLIKPVKKCFFENDIHHIFCLYTCFVPSYDFFLANSNWDWVIFVYISWNSFVMQWAIDKVQKMFYTALEFHLRDCQLIRNRLNRR